MKKIEWPASASRVARKRSKRRRLASAVTAVALCLGGMSAVLGQTPLGPEFHADDFGKNPQGFQSIGVSKGGEFLVAWQEITPDGKHDGLWSQWFSSTGQPIGKNRL